MKILFQNETQITDFNFKIMMLCRKFCKSRMEYITKFSICVSILIFIWFTDFNLTNILFCCLMSIFGIIDILEIKQKRIKSVSKLEYNFFRDKIQVFNGAYKVEIDYLDIQKIIRTKRYYFIELGKYPLVLDRKGFKVGNGKELIEFIVNKIDEQMIRGGM